jgi:DNA-binding CsgD family transcriptional regulator
LIPSKQIGGAVTPSLSAPDLKALRAVNDALLDPLSQDNMDKWLLDVCARFETLCHASTTFAGYSFVTGEASFVSHDIPEKYLDRLSELSLLEPGSLRSNDHCVEQLMQTMRRRVSTVAMSTDLIDPAGPARIPAAQVKDTPIFRDVACPLGVPGSALLFHSGASGEFMLHAAFPRIEDRPFGEMTRQVLSALLPAFAASMGALARLGEARSAIAVVLDCLDDGAIVFDSVGAKVLARNAALGGLLQRELDSAGLERRMLQSAMSAVRPESRSGETSTRALSGGWCSGSGVSYRLRTIRLPAGSVGRGEAIMVMAQRVGPIVPDAPDLMRRFSLTQREAEVAHRLALGHSDREIAAALGLSRHTVRHHAEAVFLKVGVSSRKALILHLGSAVAGDK